MIVGTNHVGISVSNLERSIEFYRAAFGMEVTVQATFDGSTANGRYEAILGMKGASGKAAMLKIGSVQLELFEFSYPTPKRSDPHRPVCDHGITHFCIEVDKDIQSHYERLKAAGATFHCPPLEFFGKATATYARDPDGNVIELLQRSVAAPSN